LALLEFEAKALTDFGFGLEAKMLALTLVYIPIKLALVSTVSATNFWLCAVTKILVWYGLKSVNMV